jgi:hypothetical protein
VCGSNARNAAWRSVSPFASARRVVVPKRFASENVQPASRCILLRLTVPDSRVVFRKPLPKTREILLWKSFHRADDLLYGAHVKSLLLSSLVRNPSVRRSVGPFDLSRSLGKPGRLEDFEIRKAVNDVRSACAEKKSPVGIFTADLEAASALTIRFRCVMRCPS